jgi:putative oxidoreductase
MEAKGQDLTTSIGLLILRLGAGAYMASHGWGKVQMIRAVQYEMFGDPIGLGSVASLWLLMFAEFVCSLLVMLGLGTRFAAVPVVIAMAVAALKVHGADPWSMETAAKAFFAGTSQTWSSKEPALLFLIPFLALLFTGAGRFSLDALFRRRARTRLPPV